MPKLKKNTLKLLAVLFVVLTGTFIAWYCNEQSLIGVDDANIYFVYMRNFAEGHGFVFNAGDEKVEGFTSLLWTLLGSFYFYISSNPEVLLLITNIALITYSLWRLICYMDDLFEDKRTITPYTLLLLGALIILPGYFDWTVLSLLETGLWSSLLILISLNLLKFKPNENRKKNNIVFYLLIFLLILCRPESVLWSAFFVFMRFIVLYLNSKSLKESVFSVLPSLLVLSISFGGLVAWREFYFGYPFPNTYYAKVSSDILDNIKYGLTYLKLSIYNFPLIIGSFIISLIGLYKVIVKKMVKFTIPLLYCLGVLWVALFIPLYTGGDHFGYSRFMQPTMPLIGLLFLLSLFVLNFKFKYIYCYVILALYSINPLGDNIFQNIFKQNSRIRTEWGIAKYCRLEADKTSRFFQDLPSYPSQGVAAAGGNSFGYKGKTNDLLALNNVEMAHSKKDEFVNIYKAHGAFNIDVFLKQQPDIFWLGAGFVQNNALTDKDYFIFVGPRRNLFKNIQFDKRFEKMYSPVLISNKNTNYSFKIFASNSFLKTLDSNNDYSYKIVPFEITDIDI